VLTFFCYAGIEIFQGKNQIALEVLKMHSIVKAYGPRCSSLFLLKEDLK